MIREYLQDKMKQVKHNLEKQFGERFAQYYYDLASKIYSALDRGHAVHLL